MSEVTKRVKLEDQDEERDQDEKRDQDEERDKDEERVSAFIQAVTQINDFFTFGLEEYDIAR